MIFRRVLVAARSVAAQQAFYEELLGLPAEDGDGQVAVRAGETELVFRPASPGTAPSYHFAFRVPGNQLAQAKRWLAERTTLLRHRGSDEITWDFWGARAVYALDPAGNVVELLAFRGLGETSRPFTPGSLLGLAELGLPARDVPAAVAALERTFGVGLWDRQRPAPDAITPLGERGASFIVVALGRPWFLGEESGDHPLDVELAGVRPGELRLPGQPVRIHGGRPPL